MEFLLSVPDTAELYKVVLNLPHTDPSFHLQEGFAPPEDDEIDEGAQGDQEEF